MHEREIDKSHIMIVVNNDIPFSEVTMNQNMRSGIEFGNYVFIEKPGVGIVHLDGAWSE